MSDAFASNTPGLDSPAGNAISVTPSNATDLTTSSRALYVGGTGDVKVDTVNGQTVTFKAVPVGVLPVRAKRVYATGTSATDIVALW